MHTTFDDIIHFRRSNRVFDKDTPVPAEIIERSLQRTILSPNSSNMQLWEFYWINDAAAKNTMAELCLSQSAAKTAQELVVFVTRKDLWKKRAQWNAQKIRENTTDQRDLAAGGIKYYEKVMPLLYTNDPFGFMTLLRRSICFFAGLNKPFMRFGGRTDQRIMVHKSCALAAQTFMLSIASEGFHTCPMEGFDQKRVKKFLKLPYGAEINMIIAVGKGTEKGIWGERYRVPYEEVVVKI